MPRQKPIGRRQTTRVVSDGPSRQPESQVLVLPLLDSPVAQLTSESPAGCVTDVPSSQSAPGKIQEAKPGKRGGAGGSNRLGVCSQGSMLGTRDVTRSGSSAAQ